MLEILLSYLFLFNQVQMPFLSLESSLILRFPFVPDPALEGFIS